MYVYRGQGLKRSFASWEHVRIFGLLPCNISVKFINKAFYITYELFFFEWRPTFLGAALPCFLYFSGPSNNEP